MHIIQYVHLAITANASACCTVKYSNDNCLGLVEQHATAMAAPAVMTADTTASDVAQDAMALDLWRPYEELEQSVKPFRFQMHAHRKRDQPN